MVVAQHVTAAQIGVEVLKRGGNAVDSAVSTAFATGVLLPIWNGIGGGGLMTVHFDGGDGGTIDFGMQAPGLAHAEMYDLEDEQDVQGPSRRFSWMKVKNNANTEGYTSIAIPGTVAGLSTALEKWGTIDLDQAIAPAVKLARDGFPLPRTVALSLSERHALLSRFSTTAEVYLNRGSPLSPGSHFVQSEYAQTLERLGRLGASEFYGGETGARIAEDVEQNGGYLRLSDFEQYRPIVQEQALSATYRGLGISAVKGPCAGPTVLEILNILQQFDIAAMGYGTVDSLHTIIEAVKLSAVDRFSFMGDPAVYGFPIDVLAQPEYAVNRAMNIDSSMATVFSAGDPWSFTGDEKPRYFPVPAGASPDSGTTSLSVADKDGNMISVTPSGGWLRSSPVIPSLGFQLSNRGQIFTLDEGSPGAIEPGKRPRTTLSPGFSNRDGKPYMAFGTPGADRQDQWALQFFLRHVHHAQNLQKAIDAPTFNTDHFPGSFYPKQAKLLSLNVEGRFSKETVAELKSRGHEVVHGEDWSQGRMTAVAKDGEFLKAGASARYMQTYAVGR